MFTGLVEETGRITKAQSRGRGRRLWVQGRVCACAAALGDSIAVNGCCLTVAGRGRLQAGLRTLEFDLLEETCLRTNLGQAPVGAVVNLERSMGAGGRFGGHFVTGHIDGTGNVSRWEPVGADYALEIACPPDFLRWLTPQGCVAVDGVSLTVAQVTSHGFLAWIIPHTLNATRLASGGKGDSVNLEGDLIAKHVERLLPSSR